MTPEALAMERMKAAMLSAEGRASGRYGSGSSSTLPRSQGKGGASGAVEDGRLRDNRLTGHPSSSSVYDNVSGHGTGSAGSSQRRGKSASGSGSVSTNSNQVHFIKTYEA